MDFLCSPQFQLNVVISYQFVIRKSAYNVAWQRNKRKGRRKRTFQRKLSRSNTVFSMEKGREKVNAYLLPDKEKCVLLC